MQQLLDSMWPTLNFSIEANMTMTIHYEFFFKEIHDFSHKKDILDGLFYKRCHQSLMFLHEKSSTFIFTTSNAINGKMFLYKVINH